MDELLQNKIQILNSPSREAPFLIIYKSAGLPSAPLTSDDKNNALFLAAQMYPEILNVKGKKEIEHGLLHRLDTETAGLMIIALNQECFDFLENEQKQDKIQKFYSAECDILSKKVLDSQEGFPPPPDFILKEGSNFTVSSYFRFYGQKNKEVRPVTQESSKIILKKIGKPKSYSTEISIKKITNKSCTVECKITNGFRHQVRAHLAWCGLSVKNDKLYNPNATDEEMKFKATKLIFEYPAGNKNIF